MALLKLFSERQPELSLAKISELLGIPKSTAHGIAKTLEECRVLQRDPVSDNYRLGAVAFQLGYIARSNIDLSRHALPLMENLLDETQQIIYLAIPYEGLVLYIEALYPPRRKVRYSVAGRTAYMHCTGLGKAMLSQMSVEEVDSVIERHGLVRLTDNTIVERESLLEELRLSRSRGYAIDARESDPMIACVAVPFRTMSGQIGGAVSVSGPYSVFTDQFISDCVERLAHVSSELSRRVSRLPF
jgi:DNA-binding IclR family transcriptional regulator